MDNQIYYVDVGSDGHLTNVSNVYQNNWKMVVVPQNRLEYFTKQYKRIAYDNNSKTLMYPSDYTKTIVEDGIVNKDWRDVEQQALNGVPVKELVTDIDFAESADTFGIFDSYNYKLTDNGLVLNAHVNPDTGACQPARFRAFDLPYQVNQYAISTLKVPRAVLNNGLDFSFWYFNTQHKYGYIGYKGNPDDFDNNEFDVDEINTGLHNATLYAWKKGDFYETPKVADDFDSEYHTLAIKWTEHNQAYYLDGVPMLDKDVDIYQDIMFPTWEIEVPKDGLSSYWGGAINYDTLPCQAVVKDYKVFNL